MMNKTPNKQYSYFTSVMNENDIKEMYKSNEEFVIPEEILGAIKALADK